MQGWYRRPLWTLQPVCSNWNDWWVRKEEIVCGTLGLSVGQDVVKNRKICESCLTQITWKVTMMTNMTTMTIMITMTTIIMATPDDHGNHDDHGDHEEFGGFVRNLEVVHKKTGGCLNSYNLQLACAR